MNSDTRNEIARGYLLLGVFFIHGLYSLTWNMDHWQQAPLSFALIKLFSPQISIYFLISGLSMRGIGRKSFRAALPQSLMLILLAFISEGAGIAAENLLYGGYGYGGHFLWQAAKPMVLGTGGCTFVTWFFTVLAVCRMLAWLFERNKPGFLAAWALIAALAFLARHLHWPDNLWEWRNWPIATLFIFIGMKIPRDWPVPRTLGLLSLPAALILTWFNIPGLWRTPSCLLCHMDFAATPEIGGYGFLPVFIAEQLLLFLFLLWAAQNPPPFITHWGRYFGRASLQFLLLHGWLLVTIMPGIAYFFPTHESLVLLLAILVLNPPVHAICFKYTEAALNRILAFAFQYGRAATQLGARRAHG